MGKILIQVFAIIAFNTCFIENAIAQCLSSDQWAATDALGRKVCDYKVAGQKKKDKFFAMFYWIWHQGDDDRTYYVKNITEIVRKYPEAMKDYHHPSWGEKQPGFFYWKQPLLGYYKTTDPWVLRKHAEMLAVAGNGNLLRKQNLPSTTINLNWRSNGAYLISWEKRST